MITRSTVMAAALAMGMGSAAFAATGTVTIDFSGTKSDPYYEDGYVLTPTKIQNSTQCAEGACTQEADEGQNLITTMTRVDPTESFYIYSFYFSLEGFGGACDPEEDDGCINALRAVGYDEFGDPIDEYVFTIGDPDAYGLLYYYVDGGGIGDATGTDNIEKSQGSTGPFYVVYSDEPLFGGEVYAVSWFGPDTAKTRLDDIVVSGIPVPGSLPALLGGLGLLAFYRRRKAA